MSPSTTKEESLPLVSNGGGGGSESKENPNKVDFHVLQELKLLLHIALPSVCVQLNMFWLFPQAASSIGLSLGTEALGGFSLGSLVGNLTLVSVMIGALSAADTLMPRAYASQRYSEVGRLAVRAVFVCIIMLIGPILPLCFCMKWILEQLGQDPIAATLAASWIRWYLLGVPANLVFRVSQRFLIAQHKPWPPVYASVLPSFVLQPILLRILIPWMGFVGSALSIVICQWAMTICLFLYLRYFPEHKEESWPGLSVDFLRAAFRPGPLLKFFSLSLGGVVSLSEWWFWESMCFVAGTFGVVSLCAHTIAYNLIPLLFMVPLGLGLGLAVRMGSVISTEPSRAKLMASWCLAFIAAIALVVAAILHFMRMAIIGLFTTDEEVIEDCLSIWGKVCFYIIIIYIFGINSAIMRALGMQWAMAVIMFACLWCATLPAVVYFGIRQGGGLSAEWTVLPAGYIIMQTILMMSYSTANWESISHDARESLNQAMNDSVRYNLQQLDGMVATEETALLE